MLSQAGIEVEALDKSRARFADQGDRWMPGRALLSYSCSSHALASLPTLTEPLIRFRDADELMRSLETNLRIVSNPPWLLRVHDDGVARQVLGNHVRTCAEYIVATTEALPADTARDLTLEETVSHTAAVKLYRMTVKEKVSQGFIHALQKLSFGYALRAHIKTFGLAPRWDDANGCSVWLSNEEIVIHLSADFPVSEFAIAINGGSKTRLPVSGNSSILASLGALSLGLHAVEVTTTAAAAVSNPNLLRSVAPETIFLEVRAPKPWQRDAAARTGLRVLVEPSGASLEELIDRRAQLSVQGPEGRTATVEARVYDMSGHVSSAQEIGRLELPINETALTAVIVKLAREPLSERIQSAPRVTLSFTVDEIGTTIASFPHTVIPLRLEARPCP